LHGNFEHQIQDGFCAFCLVSRVYQRKKGRDSGLIIINKLLKLKIMQHIRDGQVHVTCGLLYEFALGDVDESFHLPGINLALYGHLLAQSLRVGIQSCDL
jgi:hypothetical protein